MKRSGCTVQGSGSRPFSPTPLRLPDEVSVSKSKIETWSLVFRDQGIRFRGLGLGHSAPLRSASSTKFVNF